MPVGDVAKVEAYLAGLPSAQRKVLERLRSQVRRAAPKAQEGFGYGLPGFYLDGPLFYYGAGQQHCALYGTLPAGFDKELARFPRSKGALRFTLDAPLPPALVAALVRAKAGQNQGRAAAKAANRRARAQPSPRGPAWTRSQAHTRRRQA